MGSHYRTGLAKGSLISGFLSFFVGPITAIPGIFMGHMARSRAEYFPHQYSGSGIALIGLIFNYFALIMFIILIVGGYYLEENGQLEPLLNVIDPSKQLSSTLTEVLAKISEWMIKLTS